MEKILAVWGSQPILEQVNGQNMGLNRDRDPDSGWGELRNTKLAGNKNVKEVDFDKEMKLKVLEDLAYAFGQNTYKFRQKLDEFNFVKLFNDTPDRKINAFIHNHTKGEWKKAQNVYGEPLIVDENGNTIAKFTFEVVEGTRNRNLAIQSDKLLQIAEMFHDHLESTSPNAMILPMIKQVIKDAGVTLEDN